MIVEYVGGRLGVTSDDVTYLVLEHLVLLEGARVRVRLGVGVLIPLLDRASKSILCILELRLLLLYLRPVRASATATARKLDCQGGYQRVPG